MTATLPYVPDLMKAGSPRILGRGPAVRWDDHLAIYGPVHPGPGSFDLVAEVGAAGLRGRGGAAFPTSIKMEAVCSASRSSGRRRPVIVANGTEGEPASAKDKVLLANAPHLVLDGLIAAAGSIGAARAIICIDRTSRAALAAVRASMDERRRAGLDPIAIEVAETPARYTTGEETALVSWLNGGEAKPAFSLQRVADRGVGGSPTLVDNVETLANIALIARYGADAYRLAGQADEPGTLLVTVTGAVKAPGVFEVETGERLSSLLARAGAGAAPAGVLVGGYFGTWITADEARATDLSSRSLARLGGSIGCGLVAALPPEDSHCPLQEVSRVMQWMSGASAGQCGACISGLPALAGAFDSVVAGDDRASAYLDRWIPMMKGRGACKMPDGAVQFLSSARRVFAAHIQHHVSDGVCPRNHRSLLPTPEVGGWR